ncbi:MAG: hypothetical protein NWE86_01350 [Candidatus Bathyarchaeota archaeon]|nr:hypothetical protein [Candidatus Bathyarchaeota archaeon]
MKKLGVFIPILLTSVLLLMPIAPVQSNSIYLHSYTATPPILDGDIDTFAGEWDNAATQEFDTISGPSKHGKIYVMNTQTELFIAVEINDGTGDGTNDFMWITFDNDNDGTIEVGDDVLVIGRVSIFEDRNIRDATSATLDTDDSGSSDGSAVALYTGLIWTYEVSHPLKSADTEYDFQLSFGDIVGFTIRFNDSGAGASSYWPSLSGGAGSSSENYGDIGIDPPANPVGGIFIPVNKLDILTPFIALVGLIGTMSTIFAIRRWRKD